MFVRQDFALRDDERAGIIDVPQAISRHVAQSVAHFLRQKRPKTYEFLVLRMNGNESPRGRHFLSKLLITGLVLGGDRSGHAGCWRIIHEHLGRPGDHADGDSDLPGEIIIAHCIEKKPGTPSANK